MADENCLDHESEMSRYRKDDLSVWSGVLDKVPATFREFLSDASMPSENTTFCFWRLGSDKAWQIGEIDYPRLDPTTDGADDLLFALDGLPQTYIAWANEYYEMNIDREAVKRIYRLEPLDEVLIGTLNSETSFEVLQEDIAEIGYPKG